MRDTGSGDKNLGGHALRLRHRLRHRTPPPTSSTPPAPPSPPTTHSPVSTTRSHRFRRARRPSPNSPNTTGSTRSPSPSSAPRTRALPRTSWRKGTYTTLAITARYPAARRYVALLDSQAPAHPPPFLPSSPSPRHASTRDVRASWRDPSAQTTSPRRAKSSLRIPTLFTTPTAEDAPPCTTRQTLDKPL